MLISRLLDALYSDYRVPPVYVTQFSPIPTIWFIDVYAISQLPVLENENTLLKPAKTITIHSLQQFLKF